MSVFGNVYEGPFVPSGSGGTAPFVPGGYRLGSGAPPAPDYDPNSIVASRAEGSGGWVITYQNGAASRDQPDTGACWSFPIRDVGNRTLSDMGISVLDLPSSPCMLYIRERAFTAGSTVNIGIAIGNHADPAQATEGFGVSVSYPSGNTRTINRHQVNTGAWATTGSGTGNTTTFGAMWQCLFNTYTAFGTRKTYPLNSNFGMANSGATNGSQDTAAYTVTGMTHLYLFTGVSSSTADGASHEFDGSAFIIATQV